MNNNKPFVSILVVNYNGKKWLKDCFESLEKLNYPKDKYEVIMMDNASSDDSVEFTRKNFSWIKILKLDKNYGFCKPNNEGAKIAKGEYLVFLNNDTYVDKDWLIELVKPVVTDKTVISVGCKMLKPYTLNGEKIIDYAGGLFSVIIGYGLYMGLYDRDDKKYNIEKPIGFGCGAGVLIDRHFFLKTGGFDEYFFAGYEEIDLGLRCWRNGYKVMYAPRSVMFHKRLGTFGSMFSKKDNFRLALCSKNQLYFIFKNYRIKNIFIFLFWMILAFLFQIIYYFLLKGLPGPFISSLRGKIIFLRDIKNKNILHRIILKRKEINKNKKNSDKQLWKYGLIASLKDEIINLKLYFKEVERIRKKTNM